MSEEIIIDWELVFQMARKGHPVRGICAYVGIHTNTFYKKMRDHPELREKFDEARYLGEALVANKLWDIIDKGGKEAVAAIRLWMDRVSISYRPEMNINLGAQEETPLALMLATMSEEQKRKKLEEQKDLEQRLLQAE